MTTSKADAEYLSNLNTDINELINTKDTKDTIFVFVEPREKNKRQQDGSPTTETVMKTVARIGTENGDRLVLGDKTYIVEALNNAMDKAGEKLRVAIAPEAAKSEYLNKPFKERFDAQMAERTGNAKTDKTKAPKIPQSGIARPTDTNTKAATFNGLVDIRISQNGNTVLELNPDKKKASKDQTFLSPDQFIKGMKDGRFTAQIGFSKDLGNLDRDTLKFLKSALADSKLQGKISALPDTKTALINAAKNIKPTAANEPKQRPISSGGIEMGDTAFKEVLALKNTFPLENPKAKQPEKAINLQEPPAATQAVAELVEDVEDFITRFNAGGTRMTAEEVATAKMLVGLLKNQVPVVGATIAATGIEVKDTKKEVASNAVMGR